MEDKSKEFAHRIRIVRKYLNKTQIEFAKELGILQSTMSKLESGMSSPNLETIQRLGRMGFDLNWLIYGTKAKDEDILKHKTVESVTKLDKAKINNMLGVLSKEELHFCRQWLELYVASLNKK